LYKQYLKSWHFKKHRKAILSCLSLKRLKKPSGRGIGQRKKKFWQNNKDFNPAGA
jgi:hypothetical protein